MRFRSVLAFLVALLFAVRLSFCHCFAGCLTVDILDTADVSIQASSLDEWMKHGKRGVSPNLVNLNLFFNASAP